MSHEFTFPNGLHLLAKWQSGDPDARTRLMALFDTALAGDLDATFAAPAPQGRVHISGSVHMIALAILHDLYGVESRSYYNTDPERYVRANLTVSRLLGINKIYTVWALYAFTCEAIGQPMMYPDRFPPGSDPDKVLINKENWQSVTAPDFTTGVPAAITGILRVTERLTGMEPMLQISAPYSLAADIYGQEPLLADVVHKPDFVNTLLDHLADQVLTPWIEHFVSEFPNGWIELSDASGSPFFIGPENCKTIAIRAIQRMIDGKPWGPRVFDANYRGDFVTQARQKTRGRRGRTTAAPTNGISIEQLTDLKHSVCPKFVMRLEADKVPVSFYQEQAIARGVPLTLGIGSGQVDSNSVGDLDTAKQDIRQTATEYVAAIKTVCETIGWPDQATLKQPWPSHIYFEDISAESEFEMIEIIIRTVQENGVP